MSTTSTATTNGAAPTGAASVLPEAPAAASVKVLDPDGREWILTLRTSTAAAAAPICPEHGSPMRPAKRGGWFCPVEVGRHPQSGKALYCEHRA